MYATPCANTQYLRAYEREQDLADERAEWIARVARRNTDAMKPFTPHQLDEAISESMADANVRELIVTAFRNGDAEFGRAMRAAVDTYWFAYQLGEASEEYDEGGARRDYGRY